MKQQEALDKLKSGELHIAGVRWGKATTEHQVLEILVLPKAQLPAKPITIKFTDKAPWNSSTQKTNIQ